MSERHNRTSGNFGSTLAATVFFATVSSTVTAEPQTLRDATSKPRAAATSSQQSKPMKPCPAYGPGFVQVPGSDLCIKIGGSVQFDVGR
jgi:Porin subfamily